MTGRGEFDENRGVRGGGEGPRNLYASIAENACRLGHRASEAEVATWAESRGMGTDELAAIDAYQAFVIDRGRQATIATLLRLSRLPSKAPKTFDGFDFGRIQGRDADALRKLPALSSLHARKNIAFIGPQGVGKTHLAQAYGRACCLQGHKTYYLKASELRDRLDKAVKDGARRRS